MPLESMNARPDRSNVRSPPLSSSLPRASERTPTFDASSSPTRRNPRGSSTRSTWSSSAPSSGPDPTGECLHGFGRVCNGLDEPDHENGHVVARLRFPEVEHGLLDPPSHDVG